MSQMGFFDIAKRYAWLDAKNDPLVKIDAAVRWEDFRPSLEAVWRAPVGERKSAAGRKPWDAVVMFKSIVLCALYNLSDDQVEYQLRDRLSFMRFLGLGLEDPVPDAKTVWLYREQLAQAGMVEGLFAEFDGYLKDQGYLAMHDSQIVDDILDPDNTASDVWADSAYRSAEIEAKLEERSLKSRIHRKGHRNKPLNERSMRGNKTRSKVRARIEHVFGAQTNDMGGTLVRSIGLVRAKARIGLKNLAYNMRRLVQLERLAATAPP